jgi:hypothetical protein
MFISIDEPMIDQNEKTNIENPYPGSNLPDLNGYSGWNIDSSFDETLKKKEKQKKRKNKIFS